MDLDLHLHSSSSDGTVDPRELVAAASSASLDVIALTDHDTVAGVTEAIEASRGLSIDVIPAIEMSTTWTEADLHILGYFVDPTHAELLRHTREAVDRREDRLRTMVDRLNAQGIAVTFEAARSASTGSGALGRPHLAQALVEAGYASSTAEAFDLYIGNAHPAYVPTSLVNPPEAIDLIGRAGGIAVWAHPPGHQIDALLPGLIDAGLRGIEVYRPGAPAGRVARFERMAREAGLLVSGGSDWHGPDDGPLGTFRVSGAEVAELLSEGGF